MFGSSLFNLRFGLLQMVYGAFSYLKVTFQMWQDSTPCSLIDITSYIM